MAILAAADFRERTVKPYCANLILGETDGLDATIDLVIAQVTERVELDLSDDFEPAVGDADETVVFSGNGLYTLNPPDRIRSITSLSTRDDLGVLTTQGSSTYRHRPSLVGGTTMDNGRKYDELYSLSLSTGCWPTGVSSIQIIGKFGWSAAPTDIKRLVALYVYDLVKPTNDPLSNIVQRSTVDAVLTFAPSREMIEIEARYRRGGVKSS